MRVCILMLVTAVLIAAEVTINGAFARATAPSAENGAVFFTLAGGPDALLSATSPACDHVELHTVMTLKNGAKRMMPVAQIPVPGILKPGSFHLMLMGIKRPLQTGETIPLTLSFVTQSPLTIMVPIGEIAAMSASDAVPACCAPAP